MSPAKLKLWVGTYTCKGSEGIYTCEFDPTTGKTSPVVLAAATEHPSFLAVDPDGRFLYAVNELDSFQGEPTGAVSVFLIDQDSGKLTLLQQIASLGTAPAHLSLDRSARFLLVANYNGGNYAVFPIEKDGRLGAHSAFVQNAGSGVNPERQTGPHAHSIQVTQDNRFAIVADLGLDKLFVHRFDAQTGSLAPGSPEYVRADPGAGPRHVVFASSARFAYVVNELASTVTVFAYEPDSGRLHARQTISTLADDFKGMNTTGEIALDALGRFLYVSNRGEDSIVVFSVDPERGSLTHVERVSSGGKTPRNFALEPTGQWLLSANQDSDNIVLFRIDPARGTLTATAPSLMVASPVCVCLF